MRIKGAQPRACEPCVAHAIFYIVRWNNDDLNKAFPMFMKPCKC